MGFDSAELIGSVACDRMTNDPRAPKVEAQISVFENGRHVLLVVHGGPIMRVTLAGGHQLAGLVRKALAMGRLRGE